MTSLTWDCMLRLMYVYVFPLCSLSFMNAIAKRKIFLALEPRHKFVFSVEENSEKKPSYSSRTSTV